MSFFLFVYHLQVIVRSFTYLWVIHLLFFAWEKPARAYIRSFFLFLLLFDLEVSDCLEDMIEVSLEDSWTIDCFNQLVNCQAIKHHANNAAGSTLVYLHDTRIELLANELFLCCFIPLLHHCLFWENLLHLCRSWLLWNNHLLHDWHSHLLARNGHNRHHWLLGWHGWLLLPTTHHRECSRVDNWLLLVLRLVRLLSIRCVRIRIWCYNKNFEIMLTF